MDYSPSGLKRPSDNDTIGSTAATLRQQANSVLAGQWTAPALTAGRNGPFEVTFAQPFATTPRVVAGFGLEPTEVSTVTAQNVTATKFDIYIRRPTAYAGGLVITWIAVGRGTETGG